jgi:cysteine sulfinate desulfinase/cysteine desulfurase-like protein
MGRGDEPNDVTIRLGLGRFTTEAEIDRALACLRLAFRKASRSQGEARRLAGAAPA